MVLSTRSLTRRFGGLAAVNDVAIGIEHGRLHAVLGPNGAGKTTLINLLSGDLDASSGSVIYKGEDITRHSADRRSRMGIGRSYQKTNIFPAFTAFENCRLAAQSRAPRALHLFADATAFRPVIDAAEAALEAAGLARTRRPRRLDALSRRAAPARDRHGPRHAAGGAAARRAARGHGRRRGRAHGGPPAPAGAAARDPAGRARHGCRVRGRGHDHRDGQRSGARKRSAGADSRERRRARSLSRRGFRRSSPHEARTR